MSPERFGRKLLLLRHAKAAPAAGTADQIRPLASSGQRQCALLGRELLSRHYLPDLVLVSSAVRTRQTWELVEASLGGRSAAEVEVLDELYGAGPREVIDLVRGVDERARTVLVVGHEPTMSSTAYLLGSSAHSNTAALAQVRVGLPTSACAVLQVGDGWNELAPRSTELLQVISGRIVP